MVVYARQRGQDQGFSGRGSGLHEVGFFLTFFARARSTSMVLRN